MTHLGITNAWVKEPAGSHESGTRRASFAAEKLLTEPYPGINTVPDVLDYAARTHGDAPAMGKRDIVDIVEEEKEVTKTINGKEEKQIKKWKYFKLGPFQWLNYIEVRDACYEIAKGLVELGIAKDEIWNTYAATGLVPFSQILSSAHDSFTAPIGNSSNTLAHSSPSLSQQPMIPWAKKV